MGLGLFWGVGGYIVRILGIEDVICDLLRDLLVFKIFILRFLLYWC